MPLLAFFRSAQEVVLHYCVNKVLGITEQELDCGRDHRQQCLCLFFSVSLVLHKIRDRPRL